MNTRNKKALYESIMKSVAKEVKKILNESSMNTDLSDKEKEIFKKWAIIGMTPYKKKGYFSYNKKKSDIYFTRNATENNLWFAPFWFECEGRKYKQLLSDFKKLYPQLKTPINDIDVNEFELIDDLLVTMQEDYHMNDIVEKMSLYMNEVIKDFLEDNTTDSDDSDLVDEYIPELDPEQNAVRYAFKQYGYFETGAEAYFSYGATGSIEFDGDEPMIYYDDPDNPDYCPELLDLAANCLAECTPPKGYKYILDYLSDLTKKFKEIQSK